MSENDHEPEGFTKDEKKLLNLIYGRTGGDAIGTVPTGIGELDQRLGGGLPYGLTAIGGAPGAFKTTFLLQTALYNAIRAERKREEVGLAEYDDYYLDNPLGALYVTSEIALREAMARMTASLWSVGARGGEAAPSWADIARGRLTDQQKRDMLPHLRELNRIARDGNNRENDGYANSALTIFEMGKRHKDGVIDAYSVRDQKGYERAESYGDDDTDDWSVPVYVERWNNRLAKWVDEPHTSLRHRTRYRYIGDWEWHAAAGYALAIADPVNEIVSHSQSTDRHGDQVWKHDHQDDLLDHVTERLDSYGRDQKCAMVAAYRLNRQSYDKDQYGRRKPPAFGDFKGTAGIESKARVVLELVAAHDMRWSGAPKPPYEVGAGHVAVAAFILKGRYSSAMNDSPLDSPVWLDCDGAHGTMTGMGE